MQLVHAMAANVSCTVRISLQGGVLRKVMNMEHKKRQSFFFVCLWLCLMQYYVYSACVCKSALRISMAAPCCFLIIFSALLRKNRLFISRHEFLTCVYCNFHYYQIVVLNSSLFLMCFC